MWLRVVSIRNESRPKRFWIRARKTSFLLFARQKVKRSLFATFYMHNSCQAEQNLSALMNEVAKRRWLPCVCDLLMSEFVLSSMTLSGNVRSQLSHHVNRQWTKVVILVSILAYEPPLCTDLVHSRRNMINIEFTRRTFPFKFITWAFVRWVETLININLSSNFTSHT